MKVIVCGGRNYSDSFTLDYVLKQVYSDYCFTTLVQGGAKGADRLAKEWAVKNGIEVEEYLADWRRYSYGAGFERNQRMLEESGATLVVAFPGGNGTFDMMRRAKAAKGVDLIVVTENDMDRKS